MAATRKRNQPVIGPGVIFGLVMTGLGLAMLAFGYGVLDLAGLMES